AREVLRHVVRRPVEAARRQHDALARPEGAARALYHGLDTGDCAAIEREVLHVGVDHERTAMIKTAARQADDQAIAQPDLASEESPGKRRPHLEDAAPRILED